MRQEPQHPISWSRQRKTSKTTHDLAYLSEGSPEVFAVPRQDSQVLPLAPDYMRWRPLPECALSCSILKGTMIGQRPGWAGREHIPRMEHVAESTEECQGNLLVQKRYLPAPLLPPDAVISLVTTALPTPDQAWVRTRPLPVIRAVGDRR